MEAIKTLIQKTKAKYVLLSYSSGGRATKKELETILNETGKVLKIVEIDYKKNIMASMRWTNEWLNSNDSHKEYLFLMEKDNREKPIINKNDTSNILVKKEKVPAMSL